MPERLAKKADSQVRQIPASEIVLGLGDTASVTPYGEQGGLKGTVVGLSGHDFIILQMPRSAGFQQKFAAGSEVLVKCVSHGSIYGFGTVVLASALKPVPLLYVEFPFKVEQMGLRQHLRIDCSFPGRAHTRRGSFSSLLVDLSLGGAKVLVRMAENPNAKHVEKEDLILLELMFSSAEELFLGGVVRNVSSHGGALSLGLGFMHLDQQRRDRIAAFIESVRLFQQG